MQREKWQNQFGYLEEQIERLQNIAFRNDASALDPLSPQPISLQDQLAEIHEQARHLEKLVHEEVFQQKNVSAVDLLIKICRFLLEEAGKKDLPVSFSYFGSGKISMQMVEQIMPIVVFGVKAAIANSCKENGEILRAKNNLFSTCSFFLELTSDNNSVDFRIIDDGFGYENGKKPIRESIAKLTGWARFQSFTNYGGLLEVKIPAQSSRTESIIFSYGPHRIALPASSVHADPFKINKSDLVASDGFHFVSYNNSLIHACIIHPHFGLQFVEDGSDYITKELYASIVGVADFQIVILTEKVPDKKILRVVPGGEWIAPESWYQFLGLFSNIEASQALPFIDGTSLMSFYRNQWV